MYIFAMSDSLLVSFGRITRLARRTLNVPLSVVSVIEANVRRRAPDVNREPSLVVLLTALCGKLHQENETLVIPDLLEDQGIAKNLPAIIGIDGPDIRAYAGVPLHASDGTKIAILCVMDYLPRMFRAEDIALPRDFASLVGELASMHTPGDKASVARSAIEPVDGSQACAGAMSSLQKAPL